MCEHNLIEHNTFIPLVHCICDQCGKSYSPSSCDQCTFKYGNSCSLCYKKNGPKPLPPPLPEKFYCKKCKVNYNSLTIYKKHVCK